LHLYFLIFINDFLNYIHIYIIYNYLIASIESSPKKTKQNAIFSMKKERSQKNPESKTISSKMERFHPLHIKIKTGTFKTLCFINA